MNLGPILCDSCDVTYVNDIEREKDWNTIEDAAGFFSHLQCAGGDGFLPSLETMSFSASFKMPDSKGRLRMLVAHAMRQRDKKQIVQFRLIARGKPASSSDGDIEAWISLGRDWIVRGFADLTTPQAHRYWGRTR